MYNDDNKTILNRLGKQKVAIADTIVTLASQGYSVNSKKLCKLNFVIIAGHIFNQLPLFNNRHILNTRMFYNRLVEL